MNIEYLDRTGYLVVRDASSSFTVKNAQIVTEGMLLEARNKGHNRILLDLTRWSKPKNEMVRYTIGKYLSEVIRPPLKVAVLSSPDVLNRFAETVATNRGAQLRVFSDEKLAIKWLLKSTDQR
ncbi:MAG TPA: hypothetical protein VMT62_12215 [Syntrophorhabdaceae bacterium]|nr:hypothetical protein [Syntrophorhabdaceae bacterium]